MTDIKIGFILVNGEYLEIDTRCLAENGRWKAAFMGRRFLKLHGLLMEVDEATYQDFQRQRRREKYLREEAELHNEFSYNACSTGEYSGEELIVDILTNVENEAMREIMYETVRRLVNGLEQSEHELIYALFYQSMTEREYSQKTGVPRKTINDRKRRILTGMKENLEK